MNKMLCLFTIGSNEYPASQEEVERDEITINEFIEGLNYPIIPIVVPHPCEMIMYPALQTGVDGEGCFKIVERKHMLHVKVGNDEQVASKEKIEKIRKKIEKVIINNSLPISALVTHHAMEIEMFSTIDADDI